MKLFSLLMFVFATSAYAGDAASVRSVGFSTKGSYYSFIEYGTGDGSGAAYALGYILSVKNNTIVAKAELYEEEPVDGSGGSSYEEAAVAKVIAKLPLSKYAITPYKNLGEDVISRLATDKSTYAETVFVTSPGAEGGAGPTFRRYTLTIEEMQNTGNPQEDYCYEPYKDSLLKLTLSSPEYQGDDAVNLVMQNDSRIPESRRCATEYKVTRATYYKDSFVVLVSFISPGFEGPDVNSIAITAIQPLN